VKGLVEVVAWEGAAWVCEGLVVVEEVLVG